MKNACEFLADVGYEFLLSRCQQGQIVQDLIEAKVTPWPNRSGCKWIIPITWPDRVPELVTWTGQMTLPKMIKDMVSVLQKAKGVEDIRAFQAPMKGATGFDLRTAIEPLDAGFSLNELDMAIMRRVGLELLSIIGGGVAADQWDSAGENDDGQSCERLLLWSDDESAADDDGANAVAQLCVVR